MKYLLFVSLLWAPSFSLIKTYLVSMNSTHVAFYRLFLSLIVFLPLLRIKGLTMGQFGKLFWIGALQFGLMYNLYIYSYQFLAAYEVALFTIFTPLYVTLLNDWMSRSFRPVFLFTALLAVIGTLIIKYSEIHSPSLMHGFLVVQVSNVCFAYGQIAYRRFMKDNPHLGNLKVFGVLYVGAVAVALLFLSFSGPSMQVPTAAQVAVLFFLGIVSSGIGFFLWNIGATRTNPGALAIFNNLKIPLAIICSIAIFGEKTDLLRLALGGILILFALGINEKYEMKKHN